jgi:Uma2 family endonuclease
LYFSSADDIVNERMSLPHVVSRIVPKPALPLAADHDSIVGQIHASLHAYVTARRLGQIWSGIEVVLDRREGIVLQPDLVFIVDGRESIVSSSVWGPPDMVLEITSPLVHTGQVEERVAWFSLYGVREYWLLQPGPREMAVLQLAHGGVRRRTLFRHNTPIKSPLFADLDKPLDQLLTG